MHGLGASLCGSSLLVLLSTKGAAYCSLGYSEGLCGRASPQAGDCRGIGALKERHNDAGSTTGHLPAALCRTFRASVVGLPATYLPVRCSGC